MKAFRFKGTVRIAPYESGATFETRQFVSPGNVSELSMAFSEEQTKLLDYRSTSGGIDSSISRIADFTGVLAVRHFTAENLALLLWGDSLAKAAATITDEAGYKIWAGKFVGAKSLIDTTQAVTVKKGATTVLAADYTVTPHGLVFADTLTTVGVTTGDAVTFSYKSLPSARVDALLSAAPLVSIFFAAINENGGAAASVRLWKCKLGVAQNVSLIGDDFGSLQVSFTVESDDTIVGARLSQFAQIEIQE